MKRSLFLQFFLIWMLVWVGSVSASDNHVQAIKRNQILYFGTAPEYFPFVYHDAQGELTGLDVDLVREIGKRMDVEVEIVEIAYEGLTDALQVRQVDLIGGALTLPAAEQTPQADYSRAYYLGKNGLMTLPNPLIPDAFTEMDLYWMRLGIIRGTPIDQFVKTKLIGRGFIDLQQVVAYETLAEAVDGLYWNEVDLILIPENIYQRQYKLTGNYRWLSPDWLTENFAFASYRGSNLIPEVNRILNTMMTDGTAQQLAAKYAALRAEWRIPVSLDRPDSAADQTDDTCTYALRFLGDVTVADGATVQAGESFTKTWRLGNIGSCTWEQGTFLKFLDGTDLGVQRIPIDQAVAPGAAFELSAEFIAPSTEPAARSRWQMMTPSGKLFGQTVWLKINIAGGTGNDER